MARPPPSVIGSKRGRSGIAPLGGALAAMPFASLSPGLAQLSPALKQPLPAPPPMSAMPPTLSGPRATATPPVPVVLAKQSLKVKPPRIKQPKP
jgi:hypothetical protein